MLTTWQVSLRDNDEYDAYLEVLQDCSSSAVARAVKALCEGRVDRNHAFLPKPPEVAKLARDWDEAIGTVAADRALEDFRVVAYRIGEKPPPGMQSLGEYEEARRAHAEKMRGAIPGPKK